MGSAMLMLLQIISFCNKMHSSILLLSAFVFLGSISYTLGCCEHVVCGEPCPPGHSVKAGECDEMIREMANGIREKVECAPCDQWGTQLRCTYNEQGYKIKYGE